MEHHPRCSICGQLAHARELCHRHYLDWYANGERDDPLPARPRRRKVTCLALGCKQNAIARGYCTMHYKRISRRGSPD